MIYLIGGAPRVGKSKLADLLTKRHAISALPTDALDHALDLAFPQLNIRRDGWYSIPDMFFPFLRQLVGVLQFEGRDYVIEGDALFPSHAEKLHEEFGVKSVFLGTADISLESIKRFGAQNDWVSKMSEDDQAGLADDIKKKSIFLKEESLKHGVRYFDLVGDGESRLTPPYEYLMSV